MPNGPAAGPVKKETMPSLTAGGACRAHAAVAPERAPAMMANAGPVALKMPLGRNGVGVCSDQLSIGVIANTIDDVI